MSFSRIVLLAFALLFAAIGGTTAPVAYAQQQQDDSSENEDSDEGSDSATDISSPRTGAIISPTAIGEDDERTSPFIVLDPEGRSQLEKNRRLVELAEPGEFEEYVEEVVGRELPRFGSDILLPENRDFSLSMDATIPPDYRINVGDVISISLAGPVDGSVERTVDRNGEVFLPSVGSVEVAGVRSGDLKEHIAGAIGTQYRNFRVGVRINELTGIRVFVTGFANNPGSFTLSNLSTVSNAVLQAGGPSAGGSFRRVLLIRDGNQVAEFDLYELLLNGSRANDPVLENEDVLFIPPVGNEVAVFGSVNQEAIYELRGGESVADVLALAGGASTLGEPDRAIVYRANTGEITGPVELTGAELATTDARPADIIQVLPLGSLAQPRSSQSIVVTIEGEVAGPGNYYLPASSTLADVLRAAGGQTDQAFPFGTVLERLSIRAQQQVSFEQAIDQFEIALATAPLNRDNALEPGERQAQLAGARETLDQLRDTEPDGRLVLAIDPEQARLPFDLRMEHGDRITIPPRPSSVGVYGAVYRPASFQIVDGDAEIEDYLDRTGGVIRGGDRGKLFVVRANGEVLPRDEGALSAEALPGDLVFVPIKTTSSNLLDKIAQFASIVFQIGVSAAAVSATD